MSFTITHDGNITKEVWSCTNCVYCSTKKHFTDEQMCPLCSSSAQKSRTIEQSTGMSDFKYRQLLSYLEEEVGGVGTGTREEIDSHFESGDDFLDAAKEAYDAANWETLSCVNGVGDSTAEKIALGLAESEGWTGGKAETKFKL